MNRAERRAATRDRKLRLQRAVNGYTDTLTKLPATQVEAAAADLRGHFDTKARLIEVWRSKRFLVQVFEDLGVIRLSVLRCALNQAGTDWADGISWDELQAIKATVGFKDRDAYEVYPAERDVVNIANIRHLWVMPDGYRSPWVWRA